MFKYVEFSVDNDMVCFVKLFCWVCIEFGMFNSRDGEVYGNI